MLRHCVFFQVLALDNGEPSYSASCEVSFLWVSFWAALTEHKCSMRISIWIDIGLHPSENNLFPKSPQHFFWPSYHYLFNVNNRKYRKSCELCSKLTIKAPERRHWHRSGVLIVNFEHILHHFFCISIANFEQWKFSWELSLTHWSLCTLPENIRKARFQGVWIEINRMKWANISIILTPNNTIAVWKRCWKLFSIRFEEGFLLGLSVI